MPPGRFGPDPRAFFDSIYRDIAPWDVGAAQAPLVALFDEFPPAGPVLDLGCGSGALAIHLARQGLTVVGVDFAERALALAHARAIDLPPDAAGRLAFVVGDALRPSGIGANLGAITDSGFYHLLEPAQSETFVDDLARALRPGGRYYLLAFATEFPIPNTPRAVGEVELRDRFSAGRGWRTLALRPAEFRSRMQPVPAIVACFERSRQAD